MDAFCTALLRENTHLLAREGERHALTPDFKVLDESEADLLRRRVLERTLETFYETLDPGKEQLADTLGAGRDDSALAELVLEVYEKLQSHADPEAWLERSAESWGALNGSFDDTPYALALLETVRRRPATGRALLRTRRSVWRRTRHCPPDTERSSSLRRRVCIPGGEFRLGDGPAAL